MPAEGTVIDFPCHVVVWNGERDVNDAVEGVEGRHPAGGGDVALHHADLDLLHGLPFVAELPCGEKFHHQGSVALRFNHALEDGRHGCGGHFKGLLGVQVGQLDGLRGREGRRRGRHDANREKQYSELLHFVLLLFDNELSISSLPLPYALSGPRAVMEQGTGITSRHSSLREGVYSSPVSRLNSSILSSILSAMAWMPPQYSPASYHWALSSSDVLPCCSTQV